MCSNVLLPNRAPSCSLRAFACADLKGVLPHDQDGRTSPFWTLLNGATSGALAHTLTYPLDTVRRRMQISGATGAGTYRSIAHCCRVILEREGASAFFFGLAPTVIRSLPNLGLPDSKILPSVSCSSQSPCSPPAWCPLGAVPDAQLDPKRPSDSSPSAIHTFALCAWQGSNSCYTRRSRLSLASMLDAWTVTGWPPRAVAPVHVQVIECNACL